MVRGEPSISVSIERALPKWFSISVGSTEGALSLSESASGSEAMTLPHRRHRNVGPAAAESRGGRLSTCAKDERFVVVVRPERASECANEASSTIPSGSRRGGPRMPALGASQHTLIEVRSV